MGLPFIAAAMTFFASCSMVFPSGPRRHAIASSGMTRGDLDFGGLILWTAVNAINVDESAAAIEGIRIKYHSSVFTSPSETSRGSLLNSIAV